MTTQFFTFRENGNGRYITVPLDKFKINWGIDNTALLTELGTDTSPFMFTVSAYDDFIRLRKLVGFEG